MFLNTCFQFLSAYTKHPLGFSILASLYCMVPHLFLSISLVLEHARTIWEYMTLILHVIHPKKGGLVVGIRESDLWSLVRV